MFHHHLWATRDVCCIVRLIGCLLSIKICSHIIDNNNNETLGSGIKRDKGGDEKQFAWLHRRDVISNLLFYAQAILVMGADF